MKRWLLFIILSCTLSLGFGNPLLDFSQQNPAALNYQLSEQYFKDISDVTTLAERYLLAAYRANQQSATPKKLAIVFDVDETVLSNYKEIGNLPTKKKPENLGTAMDPAIPPVRNLYRVALQHKVNVFFVTGRKEHNRKALEANLKQEGYLHWAKVYMAPDDYHKASIIPYKVAARKKIADAGYEIVFSMGDQESDIEGPYTGQKYKLPNPWYHID